MQLEMFSRILARISESKPNQNRFSFAPDLEVVVLISTGDGVLSIESAEKIDLEEGFITIFTPKGRFFFAAERLLGVSCKNSRENNAGFV